MCELKLFSGCKCHSICNCVFLSMKYVMMSEHMVLDTDNLPFSADMPHRFSAGSRAAIRWRSRGNARIGSAAIRGLSARQCTDRPRMSAEAYVLD